MNKLLIYIGEGQRFDVDATVRAIEGIVGVSRARKGNFIGAIFECQFAAGGRATTVRISPEAETVTVDGLGDEAFAFALELQRRSPVPLRAIDMGCSFDLALGGLDSVAGFRSAMSATLS